MAEMPESATSDTLGAGDLPPWRLADLPEPLPFNIKNLFRTIGPGAILLATSIGGGEWLVGPTAGVKHGLSVFWIATVAIVLQTLFNLEGIRYTLYTGEPIVTGIMRLKPGSRFWGGIYSLMTIVQLGVPALAATCGPVLFAGLFQRIAGQSDSWIVLFFTYCIIALGVLLLCFGGTIERMLEHVSWVMIVYIFSFLILANVMFVPWSNWVKVVQGFFPVHNIAGVLTGSISLTNWLSTTDLLLLGTLAATAGAGGVGNLTISNWFRDKGMGMGSLVGAIGTAVTTEQHSIASTGVVFPTTPENLRRWKTWWTYAKADQIWLWGLGCFVGMFLNVNLATALIAPGTNMEGLNTGTQQAAAMSALWSGFWYLALLNGFWILFSTHLGNTDVMVRIVTDIWWVASPKVRERSRGQVSRLYYSILAAVTVWGCFAVLWGEAMALFKFLGFMANLILAISAVQVLIVNTTLLPKELRPTRIRQAMLVVCALFYGVFFVLMANNEIHKFFTPPQGSNVTSSAELKPQQQLVVAAFELDVTGVERLLKEGVDVNSVMGEHSEDQFIDKWTGSWPLTSHKWTPLLALANSFREPQPETEVEDSPEALDAAERKRAAVPVNLIQDRNSRRMRIARLLIDAGGNLEVDDGIGATPLYCAVNRGNNELAMLLIERGANVNTKTGKYIESISDMTPLHRAPGDPKLVAALLNKGADVNARNSMGNTPLFRAVFMADVDSVRLLLDAGADVNVANFRGQVPLLWAPGDAKEESQVPQNDTRRVERGAIRDLLLKAGAKDPPTP